MIEHFRGLRSSCKHFARPCVVSMLRDGGSIEHCHHTKQTTSRNTWQSSKQIRAPQRTVAQWVCSRHGSPHASLLAAVFWPTVTARAHMGNGHPGPENAERGRLLHLSSTASTACFVSGPIHYQIMTGSAKGSAANGESLAVNWPETKLEKPAEERRWLAKSEGLHWSNS